MTSFWTGKIPTFKMVTSDEKIKFESHGLYNLQSVSGKNQDGSAFIDYFLGNDLQNWLPFPFCVYKTLFIYEILCNRLEKTASILWKMFNVKYYLLNNESTAEWNFYKDFGNVVLKSALLIFIEFRKQVS